MSGLERVYVRNDKSRKVHVRVRAGTSKRLFSLEQCQQDQTEHYTFVSDLKGVALDDLCGHCFSATDAGAIEAAYASERDPEDGSAA